MLKLVMSYDGSQPAPYIRRIASNVHFLRRNVEGMSDIGPQNANQVSTIRLRMRDVDPNEQLARADNLHLLFQEPGGRGSCAWANGSRRRPGHQINACLVGHTQVGVILYIEGVG